MELKFGKWHLSLVIIFVILGFLSATAFSTQQRWGERPGPRKQNLVNFIKKKRAERDKLGDQLTKTRKELSRFDSTLADRAGKSVLYTKKLENLRLVAGLRGVRGPGLELIVGDAARVPLDSNPNSHLNPNSYLIRDSDLQVIVNALWRGGAEAVSVNGERFVANTGIRSVGSIIMINSKPQGGLYRIKAIGSPERLEKILETDNDANILISEDAQKFGLMIKITPKQKISVPPYKGSLSLTSAGEKS